MAKPRKPLPPAALPETFEGRASRAAATLSDYAEGATTRLEDLFAARSAAAREAVAALEVAAGREDLFRKRERERLATFRAYLDHLAATPPPEAQAEEEAQARREGKRIGRKAFAALVGVSPKTLLDWHAAGVFEPAYLDPKGWRFYTFEQVAEAKALLRSRRR